MPSIAVGSLAQTEAILPYVQADRPGCRPTATLAELAPQQFFSSNE
jgi:hypothetical protein